MYNSALFHGRYKSIKKIGHGGMSTVYLCVDNNIHKKWALKLISEEFNESSLITSEIALLKSLDYYMFPRITDAFKQNGSIGIVTDYIEGETMTARLKRDGPLPLLSALKYFEELLKATMYLHEQNPAILYLDMKPDNIMIRPDGEIRLIDFGIARSILLKSRSYGTPGYSPPEQYITGAELSEKTDVFALGMTLYSMLTGEKPLGNLSEQIIRIKSNTLIPFSIKEMILKCVNSNMNDRPDVQELIKELHSYEVSKKGVLPIAISGLFICMSILLCLVTLLRFSTRYRYDHYKSEMIRKASEFIEDGYYSNDGLRIICGYIDGNFLDDKTKEEFIYEVARTYFEKEKKYTEALNYFRQLDEDKYPDIKQYISVCEKMNRFDRSDTEIARLYLNEIENRKD